MTNLSEHTPLLGADTGQVGQSSFIEVAGASGEDFGGSGRASGLLTPISLGWQNICVSVTSGRGRRGCCGSESSSEFKQILRNVSGLVAPGTLLAIIGASGAGKSTLLNVLTGRNISGYEIQGEITTNGVVVGRGMKALSAYVQQDELFLSTLTVWEHLVFRALLRMDSRLGRAQRLARVEAVIQEMGLTKCAHSRIGKPGTDKSISGGEMKRLSFASEILTNPPLMFCDEPTSGLDSFMAQNIVHTLKTSASLGRTILCTIHQPSSEIFAMFDMLLLLAEGRVAYMGPTHKSVDFFNQLGHPCPMNFNPADHYVLTLAIAPGRETESQQRVEAVCDAYSYSQQCQQMKQELEYQMQHSREALNTPLFEEVFSGNSRYESSWCMQLRVVLWRSWINSIRDVILFRVRIGQTMMVGVVLGLIYLQLTYDQTGVMDINGAIFLMVTNMSFSSIFSVVNSFPIEIGIFLREYGTGLYRSDVYFLSKMFAELPSFILLPIIFSSVTYWMVGLYSDVVAFLICTGILVLTSNVAVSFGYVVSTITGSVDLALAIGPPILIPFMMFGGFFLNSKSVPDYFIWLEYISWFKYANEIIVVNQWKDVGDLVCDVPKNASDTCGRCFPNGTYVIEYLNFSEDNVIPDIGALVGLLVGFRLISYVFLLIRARRSSA